MDPAPERQGIGPYSQTQGTFTEAYQNGLLSNFGGAGISNTGGNFSVLGNLNINSDISRRPTTVYYKRQVLLESLQFDQFDIRHDNIKKPHTETCRWFLDTDAYKKWEEADSSHANNFLWIKGKPGAGKSTLMKFLHSHIHARARQKDSNEILISFFFNARGHELEKSTIGLYRSLLWQLFRKKPELQDILDDYRPGYQWTTESLKSLLEDVIQRLGKTTIFCLIDALDECDQGHIRDTILFLEVLVSVQSSIHICFASRHYPHVTVQSSLQVILEEREGHEQDIAIYLNSVLRIQPDELAEQLRSEIQKKADGVFIWVVLVVDILNKEYDSGRIYRLRERLKQLPGDLYLLFRDISTRDTNNREGLLLCIQWVLFAMEPLTPRQLHLAILSGTEPEFLPYCHSDPCLEEDAQRYILDTSKGLTQSTGSEVPIVQFIHESVRDFVLKANGLGELFSDLESNHGSSHEALRNCCLTYMTMEPLKDLEKSSPSEAIRAFPFLEYANSGVLYHANAAEHHGISQDEFLAMFPRSQWVKLHNIIEKSRGRRYAPTVSLLYVLAEAGMSDLIRAYSGRQSCFEIEDERYGVPILAASALKHDLTVQVMLELQAEQIPGFNFADFCKRFQLVGQKSHCSSQSFEFRRNRTLVEQLIKHGDEPISLFFLETADYGSWSSGVDLSELFLMACILGEFESARLLARHCTDIPTDSEMETPLHHASSFGVVEAAKTLVNRGADISATTRFGCTPLHYTTRSDSVKVALLLINCGADVSVAGNDGDTPLHDAARKGSFQVARLLLDHGADSTATNKSGETPLHHAARHGDSRVSQLLLDHGAYASATSKSGWTPLHHAAANGHLQVAQLLLDHGVDPSRTNSTNLTPLHLASRSLLEMVQLLLDRGANTRAVNNFGATPLHEACQSGNFGIARLLISCGADISATAGDGKTPLHQAYEGTADEGFISLLLDNGADISATDKSMDTPLHLASVISRPEKVQQLLDRDVNVSATNRNGETPLHKACQIAISPESVKVVKQLLESGADASAVNDDGETPLHLLLSNRLDTEIWWHSTTLRLAITEMLVDSGVGVSIPDNKGRTPVQLALSGGWKDIDRFFRSRGSPSPDSIPYHMFGTT